MWSNIYGPLELAAGGTRTVTKAGTTVSAVPFHVGADYSVFDHLKYIGVSNQSFAVPDRVVAANPCRSAAMSRRTRSSTP